MTTRLVLLILFFFFNNNHLRAACEAYFAYTVNGNEIHVDATASAGIVSSWTWLIDGVVASNAGPLTTLVVNTSGLYEVCLIIETIDGCSDDYCKSVSVESTTGPCEGVIKYETDGLHIWLDGSSSYGNITGWHWFVDGVLFSDTGPYAEYIAPEAGSYEFCLVIWNDGCCDTVCTLITVGEMGSGPCEAVIKHETDGLHIWLDGSSSYGNITGWHWFVDGVLFSDTGPYAEYIAPEAGSYEFCLVIWNDDCCDTVCTLITVGEMGSGPCEAVIKHETDGLFLYLDGSFSTGNITAWQWLLSNQVIAQEATAQVQLAQGGTYELCLIITTADNCQDTACQEITITEFTGDSEMKVYYEDGKLWLNLTASQPGTAVINLLAMDGRALLSEKIHLTIGQHQIFINDTQLPNGLVFLRVLLPDTELQAKGLLIKK
ncbi:MAG: hypothetical protein NZL95_05175 [Chitinophagales bacterium]|nr:hypothetical protein [Chitinophagales bacterium]MDW8427926.1 hypothetical protein [Chitinophagales bacterium]